ncbi:glycosyltransferase family 4 protein [Sphingobacterium suaedae]|uniref:Glycosyltransferase family 4 protein n=1 Tax=Sphingobacterium suaedae TaxID=1686402 RepID=A0ABW5KMC1_9SPHI
MQKLKVIHVVHDFLFGGIESYLFYLVQAQLQNPALEITILCCQREEKVANPRIKALPVHILYVPIKPFDIGIAKYKRISTIVSGYDIAQLHIFKPLLLIALAQSGSRVVFTVHTAGAVRREQTFYQKLKAQFQVWQLNKQCHGIVNNSRYSQQYWQEKGLRAPNNAVIYNGVQFNLSVESELVYERYPFLRGKFIVGTTSRFINWKRVDYLIRGFAKLAQENQEARLLLVGDGTEMDNLKKLVDELQLNEAVLFTGFQKNVTAYQSIMDVCVFPSVSEPFGLVAIECMHLGKPVVVMQDGGGLTELLSQVEPGHIVEDIHQLSELLLSLSHLPSDNMAHSGKRVAFAEHFNVLNIEKEYFHYYKTIAAYA